MNTSAEFPSNLPFNDARILHERFLYTVLDHHISKLYRTQQMPDRIRLFYANPRRTLTVEILPHLGYPGVVYISLDKKIIYEKTWTGFIHDFNTDTKFVNLPNQ